MHCVVSSVLCVYKCLVECRRTRVSEHCDIKVISSHGTPIVVQDTLILFDLNLVSTLFSQKKGIPPQTPQQRTPSAKESVVARLPGCVSAMKTRRFVSSLREKYGVESVVICGLISVSNSDR